MTNFADEYSTLYRNDGNYDFHDVSYKSGVALPSFPWVKWGDAFFDLDNDGWLDLIFVSGQVYPQMGDVPGAGYQQPKISISIRATAHFAMPASKPALRCRKGEFREVLPSAICSMMAMSTLWSKTWMGHR